MSATDPKLPNDLPPDESNIISSWIEAWMIGMHCILYGFCMLTLWQRRHNLTSRCLMAVSTTMIVLAIAHTALSLRGMLEAFVWQVSGPNGSAYYKNFAATPYKLKNVIYIINTFLADGLLLWRVWVVWGYNWKVAVAPTVTLLGSTVAEVFTSIALWALAPNESLFTPGVRKWFTTFWSLSLVTNVMCTSLIVVRILRSSSNWTSYRAIILVIIESGALYTMSIILHMTFYELDAYAGQITNDMQTQLAVIGPTLIIVVVGRRMATTTSTSRSTTSSARKLTSTTETGSFPMSSMSKRSDPGVVIEISRYAVVEPREKPSFLPHVTEEESV